MIVYDWIRQEIMNNMGENYVYIGSYNEDYANICCLNFYESGKSDITYLGGETACRFNNLQVMIRDTNTNNGHTRINNIRVYFKAYVHQTLVIIPKSGIIGPMQDDKKRTIFTQNFDIKINGNSNITT